jgi:hypothetical protein
MMFAFQLKPVWAKVPGVFTIGEMNFQWKIQFSKNPDGKPCVGGIGQTNLEALDT